MIKNHTILMLGILLTACATVKQPRYFYNEILIVNNSRDLIQDVKISASATGQAFSCGNIAPLGICANKLPSRPYLENPIRIDWMLGNTARQSNEFVLEVPATLDSGSPLRGVLEISPRGSISAYFEQGKGDI